MADENRRLDGVEAMKFVPLELSEMLQECNRFGRNEEVRIILKGIVANLENPADYTIREDRGCLDWLVGNFLPLESLSIRLPDNKPVVRCYTGEYYGKRVVHAVPNKKIVNAIKRVEEVIPRELTIEYYNRLER